MSENLTTENLTTNNQARLFVIAAPSGAGKTTIVGKLIARNPELRFSISYTTRTKRHTEVDGADYLFVDVAEFTSLRERGELLEHAEVFDNLYATSRSQVEQHLEEGHSVILEIDWQGAQQVRESVPECVTIFVLPPSLEELEKRLRDRGTDKAEVIDRRLRDAVGDMSHWDEFQHIIINDGLERAVAELDDVISGQGQNSARANEELRDRIDRIVSQPYNG